MRALVLAIVSVIAVLVYACHDDAVGPGRSGTVAIQIAFPEPPPTPSRAPGQGAAGPSVSTVPAPLLNLGTLGVARVQVQLFQGNSPYRSPTQLQPNGDSTQWSGSITNVAPDDYVAVVEILDGSGRLLYAGEQAITVTSGENAPKTVAVQRTHVTEQGANVSLAPDGLHLVVSWSGVTGAQEYQVKWTAGGAAACASSNLTSGPLTTTGYTIALTGTATWTVCVQATVQRERTIGSSQGAWISVGAVPVSATASTIEPQWTSPASGTVGSPLAPQPAVVVRDQFNALMSGAIPTFAIESGGGALDSAASSFTTGADGVAAAQWILGTTAGEENLLRATVSGVTDTVRFSATAAAGAVASLTVEAGTAQSAIVGTAVGTPPAARVADTYDNPVADVQVTFTARTGTVVGSPAASDASGIAVVANWTLGSVAADNSDTLVASVPGVADTAWFFATATPGTVTRIILTEGGGQTATVGTAVTTPPGVTITDQFANPKPGETVTFTASGGGTVTGSPLGTDLSGFAAVTEWTLGTLAADGSDTLFVSVAGADSFFVATATPGPLADLLVDQDGVSLSGVGATAQLAFTAQDDYGNAITGLTPSWTSLNPTVATVDPTTGLVTAIDGGQATIGVAVGTIAGYTLATVSVPGEPPVNLWVRQSTGLPGYMVDAWGVSASDVYAVGGGGLWHYDGVDWSAVDLGTLLAFTSIRGSSPSDVWAAGYNGWTAHYDGSGWSLVPIGTSASLYGVWAASPVDVFAVGDTGAIRHHDGTGWSPQPSGTLNWLYDVWGASASDVWAVGALGTIRHWDGGQWTAQTSGTTATLYAVWGTSPSDVFAVGTGGTVVHWNGSGWSAQASGTTEDITGVWGTAPNDVFAAARDSILHFDGAAWTGVLADTAVETWVRDLWGTSAGDVYGAGHDLDNGIIFRGFRGATAAILPREPLNFIGDTLHFSAVAYDAEGTEIPEATVAAWMSLDPALATVDAAGVVLARAVGNARIVVELVGGVRDTLQVEVRQVPALITVAPSGVSVSGIGTTQAFSATAVDSGGAAITSPVFTWSSLNTDVATINPASGLATAARDGQVSIQAELDGVAGYGLLTVSLDVAVPVWTWTPAGTAFNAWGIWGSSASDVWATHGEYLKHFDGVAWDSVHLGVTGAAWAGVWGTGPADVWAANLTGPAIAHFDGNTWTLVEHTPDPSAGAYRAIWGSGPDDVWVATYGTAFMRYDGQTWTGVGGVPCSITRSIWGSSRDDVWAGGSSGCMSHFNGTVWEQVSVPGATGGFRGIWGTAQSDVWAVATDGSIYHFDGSSWNTALADPTTCSAISGIWGSGLVDPLYRPGGDGDRDLFVGGDGICQANIGWENVGNFGGFGIWGTATGDVWVGDGGDVGWRGLRGVTLRMGYPFLKARTGQAFDVTVTARTPESPDPVPSYLGTVHFDNLNVTAAPAVLPADYTFTEADGGTKTFTAGMTYNGAGGFFLSVWDTNNEISSGSVLYPSPTLNQTDVIIGDPQLSSTSLSGAPGATVALTGSGFTTPGVAGQDFLYPLRTYAFVGDLFPVITVDSDNQVTVEMPTMAAGAYSMQVGVGLALDTTYLLLSNAGTWTQTSDFDEAATEPANNSYTTAPTIAATFDFTGTANFTDDKDDVFTFTLGASTTLTFSLEWGDTKDMDLYIWDSGFSSPICSATSGSANPETIAECTLAAGTYFLHVNVYDGPVDPTTYRVTGSRVGW